MYSRRVGGLVVVVYWIAIGGHGDCFSGLSNVSRCKIDCD